LPFPVLRETHLSRAFFGDVPLFVEHCEAVAAEVDVTLR